MDGHRRAAGPRPGGTFRVEANGRDFVLGEYLEGLEEAARGAHSEGWKNYRPRLAEAARGTRPEADPWIVTT